MKAKVSFYAEMPNVAKFKTRVAEPSKELTAQIREILTKVVVETVNEQVYSIRAKFIKEVAALGINYSSEANQAKVESIMEGFFDVIASVTNKAAAADEAEEEAEVAQVDAPDASDWE